MDKFIRISGIFVAVLSSVACQKLNTKSTSSDAPTSASRLSAPSGISAQNTPTTPNGSACRTDLITSDTLAQNPLVENGPVPINLICETINRTFVGKISFRSSNGNCYSATYSGTHLIPCSPNLPFLPSGQLPLPGSNFDWSAANAHCYYTQGDTGNAAPYGGTFEVLCQYRGDAGHLTSILDVSVAGNGSATTPTTSPSQPSPQQPPTPTTTPTVPNQGTLPPNQPAPGSQTQSGSPLQTPWGTFPINNFYDPTYQGITAPPGALKKVGPAIPLPSPTGCDANLFSAAKPLLDQAGFPESVACNTIGKSYVTSLSYQGADGQCYTSDLTGTYVVTCKNGFPKMPFTSEISFIGLPNPYDGTFQWRESGAVCWYTAGDIGRSGVYGVPFQSICGSFHGSANVEDYPMVNAEMHIFPYTAPIGLKKVGPAIPLPSGSCDQGLLDKVYQSQGSNQLIPEDAACRTIHKLFVASIIYQGSDDQCYQADLTGTYLVNCVPGLPRISATSSLNFTDLPKAGDSSFNWNSAYGVCYYTVGDTGEVGTGSGIYIYGLSAQAMCDFFRGN